MTKTDRYYNILGLSKQDDPTEDQIKKAYKKAALKWHPDRNRNDKKVAEEKFKDVNEAYEILSDPKKKKLYDQYGEDVAQGKMGGFGNSGANIDPSMFNNIDPSMFNNMNGFTNRGQNKPTSHFVFTSVNGNPMSGGNPSFRDPHDIFATVFGNGFNNGFNEEVSWLKDIHHKLMVSLEDLCNGCVKKIKLTLSPNQKPELYSISIKKGWKEGTKITYKTRNKRNIIFTITQKPHKYFVRQGNHLKWFCTLTKKQAEKGIKITIPTPLVDEKVLVHKKNITHGSTEILKGKGMPIKSGIGRGDLIIQFMLE